MACDDEDPAQKSASGPGNFAGKELGRLGIGELKEYIAELEGEIARAKETIAAKQAHGASAEGIFRKEK